MKTRTLLLLATFVCVTPSHVAWAEKSGTEEYGLTQQQLVRAVTAVEAHIAECMHEQGFQYEAADYATVRKGMASDKRLPGMSEDEFIEKYGFGIATMYTGEAPQLETGYSPGRVGLGDGNVGIFKNLASADRVAYNRALFGENSGATFATTLENEDFARTGGCTRKAIEQVFTPEQLQTSWYNPKDALINKDPRMKAAIKRYADAMHKAGFDYNHPDEVDDDLRDRLAAMTQGGTVRVTDMTAAQKDALARLQDHERRVAVISNRLAQEIFDPVESAIEKEMFARKVQ